ncbi:MAG: ATP-binding cassette domain-containing protein [Cyclobacteriaceae bacterium]
MGFVWTYLKTRLNGLIIASILSYLSGLGIVFIMRSFHKALKDGIDDPVHFFLLVGLALIGYVFFTLMGEKVLFDQIEEVVKKMRIDFCSNIFNSKYEDVEGKKDELFSSLVSDIKTISRILEKLPKVNQSFVISVGGIIYLIFVSWQLSLVMIFFMFPTFLVISRRNKKGYKLNKASRKSWDSVYNSFYDAIFGIKELNLNSQLKENFIENDLKRSVEKEAKKKVRFRFHSHASNTISSAILIFCICTTFAVSMTYQQMSTTVFVEFLTIALFLINPITTFSKFGKDVITLNVLADHIQEIGMQLGSNVPPKTQPIKTQNQPIYLNEVEFTYHSSEEDHNFHLGPITATIPLNEVTIICGSNGSGKSTLSKVLTGLYRPNTGSLFYGDQEITDQNLQSYRDKISAVFTDNHLFKRNEISESETERSKQLIKLFEIDRHVKIENGQMRYTGLSSGQSKRLALVLSMLHDKEIYIFDEWAANQDSKFKKSFYYKLVPMLKEANKTVILITHDDQYFSIADNLIQMIDGKIAQYKTASAS